MNAVTAQVDMDRHSSTPLCSNGEETSTTTSKPMQTSAENSESTNDHILHVMNLDLNTAFITAVRLRPLDLLHNFDAMLHLTKYIGQIERNVIVGPDIQGPTVVPEAATHMSDTICFTPAALWELQYCLFMYMLILPDLLQTIFEGEPKCVFDHFVAKYTDYMNVFVYGQNQKNEPLQYALTPLEIAVRMVTLLSQSYHMP